MPSSMRFSRGATDETQAHSREYDSNIFRGEIDCLNPDGDNMRTTFQEGHLRLYNCVYTENYHTELCPQPKFQ
jgi:hypothetical protein